MRIAISRPAESRHINSTTTSLLVLDSSCYPYLSFETTGAVLACMNSRELLLEDGPICEARGWLSGWRLVHMWGQRMFSSSVVVVVMMLTEVSIQRC